MALDQTEHVQSHTADDDQEAASAALRELEAVIAHELAVPLSIIGTATTMALDLGSDGSEAEHRNLLEAIRRNHDLATHLLRRLSLARDIDVDQVELDLVPVDLPPLVREAVGDLRHGVLRDHRVEVVAADTPIIEADRSAVHEIVFNLLTNAAKYSARGAGITVAVGTSEAAAEVVVRNHGGGVTPGDTERIFGRFVQVNERSPGSGLGLYVSRGLARAHGGDLCVRPAADKGSEFRLTLPASRT